MTLTEFLLARIAEDEAAIRDFPYPPVDVEKYLEQDMGGPHQDSEYLALHIGSGRMLAECEAKRLIIAEHPVGPDGRNPLCPRCSEFAGYEQDWAEYVDWPCLTLRALALPFASHPDYDDSWRL